MNALNQSIRQRALVFYGDSLSVFLVNPQRRRQVDNVKVEEKGREQASDK